MRRLLLALLPAAVVACAGKTPAAQAPPQASAAAPSAGSDETMTAFDLAQTGRPNLWKYTRRGPDGKDVVVRRERDLNGDGRVDVWEYYDDAGNLEKQVVDLDFDGKADVIMYFERGQMVRKEMAFGFDGKPRSIAYYEKGKLVRKEKDENGDGQHRLLGVLGERRDRSHRHRHRRRRKGGPLGESDGPPPRAPPRRHPPRRPRRRSRRSSAHGRVPRAAPARPPPSSAGRERGPARLARRERWHPPSSPYRPARPPGAGRRCDVKGGAGSSQHPPNSRTRRSAVAYFTCQVSASERNFRDRALALLGLGRLDHLPGHLVRGGLAHVAEDADGRREPGAVGRGSPA